jgi:hypothetical protein
MLGIVIAHKSLYPERSSFLEDKGVRRIIANRNNGQGGANLAVENKIADYEFQPHSISPNFSRFFI